MRTTHISCDSFDKIPNRPNTKQQRNTAIGNTLQTQQQHKDITAWARARTCGEVIFTCLPPF